MNDHHDILDDIRKAKELVESFVPDRRHRIVCHPSREEEVRAAAIELGLVPETVLPNPIVPDRNTLYIMPWIDE